MSESPEEAAQLAARFVKGLRPRERATVVALHGGLGAGKTTFVQAAARALGVGEHVTSPTFVIEKIYELDGQAFSHLIHIDAYRLKSADELERLGLRELLAEPGNLILIEWPERVPELIPTDAITIAFDFDGEKRTISIHGEEGSEKQR